MKVTRCDRCKCIFENQSYMQLKLSKFNRQRDYDLCEACEKDLENFLKVTRKDERKI